MSKILKKLFLIKIGGRLLEFENGFNNFISGLKRLYPKVALVIVHGGGKELSSWLTRLKVKYHFVGGQRFTNKEAITIAEMVLSGKVNKHIVSRLNKRGLKSVGLSLKDGGICELNQIKGLGFVGKPKKVKTDLLNVLILNGFIPVISTIGFDKKGNTLNVNADWVCPALAKALKADRMIYLTDVSGIIDKVGNTIPIIKISQIEKLINDGVIHSGMIPKVRSAKDAINKGIREIDILNGVNGLEFNSGTRILK
ncbi:MAG: acetylglutamate kinase [bacterium]